MSDLNEREQFYDRVGQLLGTTHVYKQPYKRRTRWNTRNLGNGRYPGFGTVQHFGSFIRVISHSGTRVFQTEKDVFDYIRSLTSC